MEMESTKTNARLGPKTMSSCPGSQRQTPSTSPPPKSSATANFVVFFLFSSQLLDLLKDKTALQDPGQDPDAAEDVIHEMSNGHATAIAEELASAPEASEIEQCSKPEADGQEIDPFDCACSAEEVDPIGATNDDFAPEVFLCHKLSQIESREQRLCRTTVVVCSGIHRAHCVCVYLQIGRSFHS